MYAFGTMFMPFFIWIVSSRRLCVGVCDYATLPPMPHFFRIFIFHLLMLFPLISFIRRVTSCLWWMISFNNDQEMSLLSLSIFLCYVWRDCFSSFRVIVIFYPPFSDLFSFFEKTKCEFMNEFAVFFLLLSLLHYIAAITVLHEF